MLLIPPRELPAKYPEHCTDVLEIRWRLIKVGYSSVDSTYRPVAIELEKTHTQ
jgi:hypothetical protein